MTDVTIRSYRPADHGAGGRLWVELIEEHRELYDDPGYGGGDPGAGFEEYLTRLDLSGVWVAERPEAEVVGLVGLIVGDGGGRIEPVVVTTRLRGQGISRALLARSPTRRAGAGWPG